jgi:hypothetical protein
MTTKPKGLIMKKLTKRDIRIHFHKAESIALALIEKGAREILAKHPELDEFIMSMGDAFFTKKNEVGYVDVEDIKNTFSAIIYEWDDVLHLTGTAMRFTAKGKKITDW